MNTSTRQLLSGIVIACLCTFPAGVRAQDTATTETQTTVTTPGGVADAPAADEPAAAEGDVQSQRRRRDGERRGDGEHQIISIGSDSRLAKGESADTVVSVFGSSTSEGDVSDAVVSVLGDTRVSGSVGDAAVAVLGDVHVDGKVLGDVVAVLGSVELGPEADVDGDIVSIGGAVRRDPAAVVHGGINNIAAGLGNFRWLRPWVDNCLLYVRPLAIAPGLGWAWGLALGFLALYALIALLFRDTVDRCVRTLETRPGQSVAAAVLAMLLTPVLFVLLFITIIGIALVPFAALALFVAGIFGKAVVLAWIGRSCTRFLGEGAGLHTALAVLTGGVIVLALYLVPVLGFIVYKALGILGFGVVVYVLILAAKAWRGEAPPPLAPAGVSAGGGGAAFADAPGTFGNGGGGTAAGGASGTVPPPDATAAALSATTLPRAGFWIRMLALFIDALLVGVVLSFLDNSTQIELIVLAAYGAAMWKLRGTTIGGIVCGLRVARLDGRPIDWPTAIVRALGCFLSLIVVGLGFIWIAFDEGRQSWHDKIAGTVVVHAPKGASLL